MQVGERFGRYTLLRLIAEGGMGQLWMARLEGQDGFQKIVALKTVLEHLAKDKRFLQMFLDEARICARLVHPNVCQVFELDQAEGIHYLAMEFLKGVDLAELFRATARRDRRIPLALIGRLMADAAAGLDYAHSLADEQGQPYNLVHRDVSPHNIFVTFDGAVKIIDFGIAKARGRLSEKTKTGLVKGKYPYMSPEQTMGIELDRRSDIFALGTVFHELLTRMPLFADENAIVTLLKVREAVVAPPSAVDPSLPKSLDDIVLKALARDRESRYATAHEMRMAIEDWLAREQTASSAAHLVAFMREAQIEKVAAEERAQDEMPEVSAVPVDDVATNELPIAPAKNPFLSSPGAPASPPVEATPPSAPPATLPVARPPQKKRGLWPVFAALGVVGVAWGAVFLRPAPVDRTPIEHELQMPAPVTCQMKDADVARVTKALAAGAPLTGTSAEELALRAKVALAADRNDEARDAAAQAKNACPSWALPHHLLGRALDDKNEAEASFRIAAQLAPAWEPPRFNLALVLLMKPDPKAAVGVLDELIAKNASYPKAHLIRGQAHLLLKDYDAAVRDLEEAVKAQPNDEAAQKLLAAARKK